MAGMLEWVFNALLSPFRLLMDSLTDPKNLLEVANRGFRALESADVTLMNYSLPAIFTVAGYFLALLGLAWGVFQYVRGVPAKTALWPLLFPLLLLPLFSYRGAPCKERSEGFPCVADVSFERQVVSLGELPPEPGGPQPEGGR